MYSPLLPRMSLPGKDVSVSWQLAGAPSVARLHRKLLCRTRDVAGPVILEPLWLHSAYG